MSFAPPTISQSNLVRLFERLRYSKQVTTQQEFGDKLGYKKSFTSQILNGLSPVPPEVAEKVQSAFGLSPDVWIVPEEETSVETSAGPMQGRVVKNPLSAPGATDAGSVPFYDVDFAAGTGIQFYEDNIEQPAYTMQIPGFAGCIAFASYGDSMEKLIRRGSILFGRKLEDWRSFLEYGQIYGIVMTDGRRFLKYVRKAADPKKHFLLQSENEKYDPFEVPQSKIHNVWLIEGWMLKTA